jgi:conjugative relaxase-like TrwC/TraI family protein
MLRVTTSTSAAAAKAYYTEGFSRQDYYVDGQEIVGQWGGEGAKLLGLSGHVDREAFMALCDNLHPATGQPLTARNKQIRRVGYDFTFSVPKSVSLLYAITGDERIVQAFRECVEETMKDIEKEAKTRVRIDGADFDRPTGKLVRAEFVHFTSRPVDGTPDPHLHAHIFVFNATLDEEENRWKAVQLGDVKRDAPFFESAFQNRMAAKLNAMGYPTERKAKAYEIKGIPEELNRRFSRRTAQIDQLAESLGITDAAAKDALGAATRQAKMKNLNREELRELYVSRLSPDEHSHFLRLYEASIRPSRELGRFSQMPTPKAAKEPSDGTAEREALEFAILHNFERESVVTASKLLETALRFGVGYIDLDKLKEVAASHPTLLRQTVDGREYVTTPQVVREERAMVEWVRFGRGTAAPLAPGHRIVDERLNDHQRVAVMHVLESTDMVTGVNGRAGTGKTTAMKEAIGAIETNGRKVFVFAPTAEAARDILRREGFQQAETVEQLLTSEKLQEQAKGGILWIDEAGLLSGRAMARVARLAETINARVVLSGDSGQHRAVERGDALRILEQHAGLELATLGRIQRQEGLYRDAVEDVSVGRIVQAFKKLDELGAIVEIPNEERYKILADEYLTAIRENASALVVSPTHSEIRKVTERIREGLKSDGRLGDHRNVNMLRRIDLTEAERADVRSYRESWVIEMIKSARGFAPCERLTVERIEPKGLWVKQADGKERFLDNKTYAGRFQVYERDVLPVAIGEQIRITKNGRAADGRYRLHNGSFQTVVGFTGDGDMQLANGRVVPRNFAHLDYGYATTSHAAQGKTVDRVFIAESSESFVAASKEQFYVSVSRGRRMVRVFTDDREELLEAVHATSQRISATDLQFGAIQRGEEPVIDNTPEPENPFPSPAPIKESLGRQNLPSPELSEELNDLVEERDEPEPEIEM